MTISIEVDDFYPSPGVLEGLRRLSQNAGVRIYLFVLLGLTTDSSMETVLQLGKDTSLSVCLIGVHGWNHLESMHTFGYWEMRHLLETAISWGCFDNLLATPWNRMPRHGALRAMKEYNVNLVTPYKWQRIIATIMGCNAIDLRPDMLLHPPDLLDQDKLDQVIKDLSEYDPS